MHSVQVNSGQTYCVNENNFLISFFLKQGAEKQTVRPLMDDLEFAIQKYKGLRVVLVM